MGESFGQWRMGKDEEIMQFVSSANIACGFHAGDPDTIAKTIRFAKAAGVAVGAHPSFPDLEGFGRRKMTIPPETVKNIVAYQISAVAGMCRAQGIELRHVKPHGALYNMAAKDTELAAAIASAVKSVDSNLILYGLSGSALIDEAKSVGLRAINEVFADRGYDSEGHLVPRGTEGSMIRNPEAALQQVLELVGQGTVTAVSGELVNVEAETICIHGDADTALEFASTIYSGLLSAGYVIESP